MLILATSLGFALCSADTAPLQADDYIRIEPLFISNVILTKHGKSTWPGFLALNVKEQVAGVSEAERHADHTVAAAATTLGFAVATVGFIVASAIHDKDAYGRWPNFYGHDTTSSVLNASWLGSFVGLIAASQITRNELFLSVAKYNEAVFDSAAAH